MGNEIDKEVLYDILYYSELNSFLFLFETIESVKNLMDRFACILSANTKRHIDAQFIDHSDNYRILYIKITVDKTKSFNISINFDNANIYTD